ncbi:ribokinase [Agromyces flavus]|uniref:Ribokinase n=1 Tax=Agromyces flavus TaxID=589382 RepID=A0A1H1ZI32_9MICO|nr:ribokinase [Agromyces flavus]MCP2367106.1 ribokinase [Agromyces flavus]GGI46388.1 ribokinase [Agromyces flavus]SDT33378.1 ribokinase [Agromyces flavus]
MLGERSHGGVVVVFGSVNVDATSYVREFPRPGETVHSSGFRVALGGKGANQAVAAHLSGARVELIARVGDDANADVPMRTFAAFGLATDGVAAVPGEPTGVAQITVNGAGENTIVVTAGANAAFGAEVVEAERERIARGDVVLTQGELPTATIEALSVAADAAGARFVLNLAPPVPVAVGSIALADPLVLNVHEARVVGLGVGLDDDARPDAWRDAAASAVGALARSVVVTLGARGAVAADRTGSWTVPAPDVRAVDTTGAGDAATGTLAAMLAEGRPLPEAVRLAVAAGALAVLRQGTVDSYAARDAVLGLAERMEDA